jgi:hypothetical protein
LPLGRGTRTVRLLKFAQQKGLSAAAACDMPEIGVVGPSTLKTTTLTTATNLRTSSHQPCGNRPASTQIRLHDTRSLIVSFPSPRVGKICRLIHRGDTIIPEQMCSMGLDGNPYVDEAATQDGKLQMFTSSLILWLLARLWPYPRLPRVVAVAVAPY